MAENKRAIRGAFPGSGGESNAILRVALADLGHTPVSYGHTGEQSSGVPQNMARPAISGTLAVGETLTVTNGAWAFAPTSYTRQWKRDGVNIGSATNATYVLVSAEGGTTITATVTATNANGSASASSAGVAIPASETPTPLLDIRASALVLSDGDPVGTWANAGTAGGSFTAAGSARPTYHAGAGHPYLQFDGVNDFMALGATPSAALDNLPSFAIFAVVATDTTNPGNVDAPTICKIGDVSASAAGWHLGLEGSLFFLEDDGGSAYRTIAGATVPDVTFHIVTVSMTTPSDGHLYYNSVLDDATNTGSGTANFSNSEPVRLGVEGDGGVYDGFLAQRIAAIRIYAPAPSPSGQATIEADMAADTGVTL